MTLTATGEWSIQQWKGLWWVLRPNGRIAGYAATEVEAQRKMQIARGVAGHVARTD